MAKPGKITAMISSTAADLPEHRKQAFDACLREGVFPIGMEHLPAHDATGIQASLEMVDQADIYIGIYAWRYGWVPDVSGVLNPDNISITEMEFNHALERRQRGELKDILIFVMHDDHPIRARDKEDGAEAQEKLRKFKDRASTGRVRLTFSSPDQLRGHVVQSLGESLRRIEAAEARAKPSEPAKLDLHPPTLIPTAPQPYIAHPYSLLQTAQVVGRQAEYERPFVLVLDGLERILLAYARMDAARMPDDDLDERTANRVARAHGLPESAAQSFVGKHQLRLTADQRAGQFLRRLARVRASRLLISTRLYPAELQADTGDPLPGCYAVFLPGLTDDDALNLWRELKVSGSREQLLPLFRSFGNYPLLVRALAGEVASYRPAPRDFDQWRADNPGFDPAAQLDLKNAKTHVLEYALRGLGETQRKVLHTLAAFRMPATWDTLRALLIEAPRPLGEGRGNGKEPRPCADNRALDTVLWRTAA